MLPDAVLQRLLPLLGEHSGRCRTVAAAALRLDPAALGLLWRLLADRWLAQLLPCEGCFLLEQEEGAEWLDPVWWIS